MLRDNYDHCAPKKRCTKNLETWRTNRPSLYALFFDDSTDTECKCIAQHSKCFHFLTVSKLRL